MVNNDCDKCYEMRQPRTIQCPKCGKSTYVGQVVGISCSWTCSSCGEGVASSGGFPPACWSDEKYTLSIEKPKDASSMVKLARILNRSVLDLNNDFKDSNELLLNLKLLDCVKAYKAIISSDVLCKMDPLILQNYSRILNCTYIEK